MKPIFADAGSSVSCPRVSVSSASPGCVSTSPSALIAALAGSAPRWRNTMRPPVSSTSMK
jgi:hypothetical protein